MAAGIESPAFIRAPPREGILEIPMSFPAAPPCEPGFRFAIVQRLGKSLLQVPMWRRAKWYLLG